MCCGGQSNSKTRLQLACRLREQAVNKQQQQLLQYAGRVCVKIGLSWLTFHTTISQHINLTSLSPAHRLPLLHRLSRPCSSSYARYLRSLSIKVALGSASSHQQQLLLLDHNDALSIDQMVSLLDNLPYLTSLNLELVNILPGSYISRLPSAVQAALQRNGHHISHLSIKSCQLKTLASLATADGSPQSIACPFFQLDEHLVADIISTLPHLRSLSLGEITYDSLSSISPLYEAIKSLAHLKKLEVSDTSSAFNERWAFGIPYGSYRISEINHLQR